MDCPRYSKYQFRNFSTIINRKYKCNWYINKPTSSKKFNVSVNIERNHVTKGIPYYSIQVNLLGNVNKTICKIV